MTCHAQSNPCLALCNFHESINPHVSSLPFKACDSTSKWELEKQHSRCFTEKTKSRLLLTNIYKNYIRGTLSSVVFLDSLKLSTSNQEEAGVYIVTQQPSLNPSARHRVWNVLILRTIMRNIHVVWSIYSKYIVHYIVYLLSITSSSPELSQTSQSTVPHKTVFMLTPTTSGGSPGHLHFWPAGYKFRGSYYPTTLRTQESTVLRITVLL